MKPKIYIDNGEWVCSHPGICTHIAGFGDTPSEAYQNWECSIAIEGVKLSRLKGRR